MSLEPIHAPFRCWDHGDCLEHPELALACADGSRTALAMFSASDHFEHPGWHGRGWSDGDGMSCHDQEAGRGDGFPLTSDQEQAVPTADEVYIQTSIQFDWMTDYERVLWWQCMLRVP